MSDFYETGDDDVNGDELGMIGDAVEAATGLRLPDDVLGQIAGELGIDIGDDETGAFARPRRPTPSRAPQRFQPRRGAPPARRPASAIQARQLAAAVQRELAMTRAGGSCKVAPLNSGCGPSGAELPLGFDSVATIAAGASQAVTSQPQAPFQPYRLSVPAGGPASGDNFIITDIKVGTRSQMAGSPAMPASSFANIAVGASLKMEAASTSQNITIIVTNIDAAAHRFLATMFGEYCY